MAENFNLIFGSQAPTTASWSDADYQTGWNVVGSTPPTAEQFDALQNRADKKAQELNNRMLPLEQKAEEQGRQASTAYTVGAAVTVDGLPADWLLVCTTAGTSGTVTITLPNPLLDGATINDGTITWTLRKIATNGSLGYRQPSTAYATGNIAYHASLPTGWYLECTTAGTTGSGNLTISSPSIGGTVSDGTVVWTVWQSGRGLTDFLTGLLTTNYGLQLHNNTKEIRLMAGESINDSAYVIARGSDHPNFPGQIDIRAYADSNDSSLVLKPTGVLLWVGNDLGGSAIIAKSLGINGYIKYASGLILQWGYAHTDATTKEAQITLPISMTGSGNQNYRPQLTAINNPSLGLAFVDNSRTQTGFTVKSSAESFFSWFIIGH